MSYSRWINSSFYTYWCSTKSDKKEDQIFMCHTGLLEQHELKYGQVKDYLVDTEALMYDLYLDEKEANELLGYMRSFVRDVDTKYGGEDKGFEESNYG
tara:strand:- start:130 stop:423 length:294 start_codon:yes stop_codon:yes gene_type:complete